MFEEGDATGANVWSRVSMSTCPRCAAQNEADRSACWNCFAPLTGPQAAKVKPMTLVAKPAAEPEVAPEQPAPAKKKGLFRKK